MQTFDLVVIGAGPGGYPAAIRGAQLGAAVAIVQKERMDGTCLNWGCIPTKTLIASSILYHRIKHADSMGINAGACTFDYAAMVKRKDTLVSRLSGGVEQLLADSQGAGPYGAHREVLLCFSRQGAGVGRKQRVRQMDRGLTDRSAFGGAGDRAACDGIDRRGGGCRSFRPDNERTGADRSLSPHPVGGLGGGGTRGAW